MLLVVVTLVVPTAATAASYDPGENCVFLVHRAEPDKDTPPTSKVCGDEATLKAASAARSWLARIYEHASWGGSWADIYGDDGPCDREGYTINLYNLSTWAYRISSYRLYGGCYWSYYTNLLGNNTSYGHIGDVQYVGDYYNDGISIMKVWAR
ncbi:hypothetical protein OHA25_37540 [Nonomuraea sp. NBC_00507]|uniref:hypothetical protein n=1 Tax=Nonomuraea sp. NBC_00507 TaxID=2976002 RepID=UPI002E17B3D6